MSDDPASSKQEIVIVRRRGGDDLAGAKGGAWKIAYADFVTAMMAFFLVMWLINASNEATRAQVASYFNPIKLTDSSTGKRGLKELKSSSTAESGEASATAGGTPPAPSDTRHESEIMANPDKVLEKIEAEVARSQSLEKDPLPSSRLADGAPGVGDPFDPRSWEKAPEQAPPETAAAPKNDDPGEPASAPPAKIDHSASSVDNSTADKAAGTPAAAEKKLETVETKPAELIPALAEPKLSDRDQPGEATEAAKPSEAATSQTIAVQDQEARAIAAEIAKALGTGLDELPASIDVKKTDQGTLISLTDSQSFGMFKTGSAEPEAELVRLIEAISAVIQKRPGYVVVRGHTDSRPYRNKRYDNWQLSTARAHLAQYMLVRGGLEEGRIRRVEGLADREPRNPQDPQAAENRRIEILLGWEAMP